MEIVYKKEGYEILGACYEVYKEKGSGFLESVYQECLGLELLLRNIPYEQQPFLRMNYKGTPLRQTYVPDFLCYGKIILEIKSLKCLGDEHRAQTINYLKATELKLGLLVNFGHHPKVEYQRFVNL